MTNGGALPRTVDKSRLPARPAGRFRIFIIANLEDLIPWWPPIGRQATYLTE
jgi:hypothetical protein